MFHNHGDRTNKAKARIRHILQKVGEGEFRRMVSYYVAEAKKDGIPYKIEKKLNILPKKEKSV